MEISELQAFIAVANSGSFSKAAAKLFITQPAVSKRIAGLESELNARLLDRIGRKVTLTEMGRALLPRAKALLAEISDIKRLASSLTGEVSGPLLVGTSHHAGLHRLPPVLSAYTKHYPRVQLDIRFMDSEAAIRAVEVGDLELAIVTLPLEQPGNLKMTAIWNDPLQVMTGKDHPLAKKKKTTLQELVTYPAVLPGPTTYTREILQQVLADAGLKASVSMSTNYLETLKMLVATGQGWSLLPVTMLDETVVALRLPMTIERTLGVVVHAGRTLSNAAHALIQLLKQFQD